MVTSIQDWRFKKLKEEEEWEASRVFEDVADGDVKTVYVDNPVDNKSISVEEVVVSTEGKLRVERFGNVDEVSEGDLMLVNNKKIGSVKSVPFDFRVGGVGEAGDYDESAGVQQQENLITGSVSGNKIGGGTESRPAFIVESDNNYLLWFENQSGQSINFSVQIEFAEVE